GALAASARAAANVESRQQAHGGSLNVGSARSSTSSRSPLFPGPGRFTLPELLPSAGGDTAALTARLWNAAWAGAVTNDTFAAVRKGVLSRFRPAPVEAAQPAPGLTGGRLGGRRGFARWQTSRAFTGRWYPLALPDP